LKKEIDKKNTDIDQLLNTLTAKTKEIDEIKAVFKEMKLLKD
jgi:hypothetical protein